MRTLFFLQITSRQLYLVSFVFWNDWKKIDILFCFFVFLFFLLAKTEATREFITKTISLIILSVIIDQSSIIGMVANCNLCFYKWYDSQGIYGMGAKKNVELSPKNKCYDSQIINCMVALE